MPGLTTLLFDVDGTLADTEEVHRISFNRSFAQAGLDWEWSQTMYAQLLATTGGKERIQKFIDAQVPGFEAPMELQEFIAGLHAAKTDIYTRKAAAGEIPLRPGVKRLLQEARDVGLRLGIATTTTPANVTALLRHSLAEDAEDWFEVIAAGGMVAAKKPAADVFLYAMEKLGVTPAECLAFEDSENGLRAARDAGLATLVTVNEYTRDHNFNGAALVLDQLGEPDAPFTVLAGNAGNHRYVTVDLLKELHSSIR